MDKSPGFTLIEILLSMVLLATVFSSVVSFLVTMKKWTANRNLNTLKLQFTAMDVLDAEFRKLTYSSRNSIASSVDSGLVSSSINVSIFRIRPALDGGNRPVDAPVLAFAVARER